MSVKIDTRINNTLVKRSEVLCNLYYLYIKVTKINEYAKNAINKIEADRMKVIVTKPILTEELKKAEKPIKS